MLCVGFTITWTAITDPETFRSDNVLNLAFDVLDAVIDSSGQYRDYVADGFDVSKVSSRSLVKQSNELGSGEATARITMKLKGMYEKWQLSPSPAFARRMPDLKTYRRLDDEGNLIHPEDEGIEA